MSSQVEQKRRELFESIFATDANLDMSDTHTGVYEAVYVRNYWHAFNAALDAVVIELPDVMDLPKDYWGGIDDCLAAIEQTGLGLKVLS